jgi:hypothetical protein
MTSDESLMLKELLLKNENSILKRWLDLLLETYPPDSETLMRKGKDQFTNPVGSTLSLETEVLFKKLREGIEDEKSQASLDAILKIRSVQDFSPSKAVEFIFLLKKAIGETLKGEMGKESVIVEWLQFQSRIDNLALQAFDIYMGCREKIYEIRVNQAKGEKEMAFRMMERMTYSKEKRQKKES